MNNNTYLLIKIINWLCADDDVLENVYHISVENSYITIIATVLSTSENLYFVSYFVFGMFIDKVHYIDTERLI